MEIDQPIAHLVDESQPTPNNMTNELMNNIFITTKVFI
jgi:hypothetical protein